MPLNDCERRSEPRHPYFSSIEFPVLPENAEETVIGTTINISNSRLGIYSCVTLNEKQEITIRSAFPSNYRASTIRRVNKLLDDFFVVGLQRKN
ncbi:MAG TPA: hypothetical protein VED67_02585 [Thermodesulfovibrionales bacterium]|nr:hypothetical protein [Thermodesulfovibrionales bacterium]